MLRAALAFLAFFFVSLAIQAPATLLDGWVQGVTARNLAIADVEGSLWHGSGRIAVRNPETGLRTPLTPVSWAWRPLDLLHLRVSWSFSVAGLPPFTLAASPSGALADGVAIQLPIHDVLEQIPNTVAAAGWRGDLSVDIERWQCSWVAHCTGRADIFWRGATSDLFPGRALGNYHLLAEGRGDIIGLQLETLGQAEIQLVAQGQIPRQGGASLQGSVEGDPTFVGRLPDVAGRWVQKTDNPGKMLFNFNG